MFNEISYSSKMKRRLAQYSGINLVNLRYTPSAAKIFFLTCVYNLKDLY